MARVQQQLQIRTGALTWNADSIAALVYIPRVVVSTEREPVLARPPVAESRERL